MNTIDYAYTLDFLKRLNRVTIEGKSIADWFSFEGYNLWQSYQESLLIAIREHSKTKTTPTISRRIYLRDVGVGIGMFLISLCSVLFSRGKILVYTIDHVTSRYKSDRRGEAIYEALEKSNKKFFEIIHTIPGRKTLQHAFMRRRPVVYLESIDFLTRIFLWGGLQKMYPHDTEVGANEFTREEQVFVRFLIRKMCDMKRKSVARVHILRRLFAYGKFPLFISIDEMRHSGELYIACHEYTVRSIAIQHGQFTKYQVGWIHMTDPAGIIPRADTILVWSNYWKHELIRFGTFFPESSIIVGGVLQSVPDSVQKKDDGVITIMIPYETIAPKEEVIQYITAFESCGGVRFLFKVRKDMSREEQQTAYGFLGTHRAVSVCDDAEEDMPFVDVVVGTYSTYLYDVIAYEKPVAIVQTSMDYGMGMVENKLADLIDTTSGDVCAVIQRIAQTPNETLRHRKEQLFGSHPHTMVSTLQDILQSI